MHTILALSAPSVGRVIEVVQTLSAVTWPDRQPGDWASLGAEVEGEISRRADRIMRGEPLHNAGGVSSWRLNLSADPPAAWLTKTINDQVYERHYATPAGEQHRPLMHVTRIGPEIINCAAELLADSFLGTVPKRETAASPGRESAALTGTNETTEPLPPAEPVDCTSAVRGTEKFDWGQGVSLRGSGKSSVTEDRTHGRNQARQLAISL